jgi:hypothetical protein
VLGIETSSKTHIAKKLLEVLRVNTTLKCLYPGHTIPSLDMNDELFDKLHARRTGLVLDAYNCEREVTEILSGIVSGSMNPFKRKVTGKLVDRPQMEEAVEEV